MHAFVLGICLKEDQPWRRSSVVSLAIPMLPFDAFCCFLMLFAVAAAVARCTPDNCTFETLTGCTFRCSVSSSVHLTGCVCKVMTSMTHEWLQPSHAHRGNLSPMSRNLALGPCRPYFVLISKTGRFWEKILRRLWFTFLGRCGRGLLFSLLQS